MRQPLVAGNWKMNGLRGSIAEAAALVEALNSDVGAGDAPQADVLLCPPFTLIGEVARAAAGSALQVGGQTCHPEASGAHTGEVAAEMIADLGAGWVIVGHSERREAGESDAVEYWIDEGPLIAYGPSITVLAHQARVPGRSAGQDDDAADVAQLPVRQAQA